VLKLISRGLSNPVLTPRLPRGNPVARNQERMHDEDVNEVHFLVRKGIEAPLVRMHLYLSHARNGNKFSR